MWEAGCCGWQRQLLLLVFAVLRHKQLVSCMQIVQLHAGRCCCAELLALLQTHSTSTQKHPRTAIQHQELPGHMCA
jgi:hypothetical protein